MDPCSRHQVWALLKSRRAGRVIVLSTHYMDEADILAGRNTHGFRKPRVDYFLVKKCFFKAAASICYYKGFLYLYYVHLPHSSHCSHSHLRSNCLLQIAKL